MNVYHMIKLLSKNSHDGSTSVMSRTSFLVAEVRFLQGKSSFISTLSSHLVMSLLLSSPYFLLLTQSVNASVIKSRADLRPDSQ